MVDISPYICKIRDYITKYPDRSALVKGNALNLKPKTVIIIGNGSIKNGWTPLKASDLCVKNDPMLRLIEEANHFRFGSAQKLRLTSKRTCYHFSSSQIQQYTQNAEEVMQLAMDTRVKVADLYKQSLELRDIPSVILEEIAKDAGVITTNWDATLWKNDSFPNLIQLHGLCEYNESLIFPTELVLDSELVCDIVRNNYFNFNLSEKIKKRADYLGIAEKISECWLHHSENLKQIIIWGLHLNDYDSEVIGLLSMCAKTLKKQNRCLDQLQIINPDKNAAIKIAHILGHVSKNILHNYEDWLKRE